MKAAHGFHAPSTSLLRFLRSQLDTQTLTHPPHRSSTANRYRTSTAPASLNRTCRATIHTSPWTPSPIQSRSLSTPPSSSPSPSSSRACSVANHKHKRQPQSSRSFSISPVSREGFWRRLRPQPRSAGSRPLLQDDLPPLPGFLDDSVGLGGRKIKPSNELKLRCTEFDENGNVTLVNGEFRKSELIAKVCYTLSSNAACLSCILTCLASTHYSPEISARSTAACCHTSSSAPQPS